MTDEPPYKIGYGKPPLHTRFKKGVCPNPHGRGAGARLNATPVDGFLKEQIQFRQDGRVKTATPNELAFQRLVSLALNSDPASAKTLLDLWKQERSDDENIIEIHITGGLPV